MFLEHFLAFVGPRASPNHSTLLDVFIEPPKLPLPLREGAPLSDMKRLEQLVRRLKLAIGAPTSGGVGTESDDE